MPQCSYTHEQNASSTASAELSTPPLRWSCSSSDASLPHSGQDSLGRPPPRLLPLSFLRALRCSLLLLSFPPGLVARDTAKRGPAPRRLLSLSFRLSDSALTSRQNGNVFSPPRRPGHGQPRRGARATRHPHRRPKDLLPPCAWGLLSTAAPAPALAKARWNVRRATTTAVTRSSTWVSPDPAGSASGRSTATLLRETMEPLMRSARADEGYRDAGWKAFKAGAPGPDHAAAEAVERSLYLCGGGGTFTWIERCSE